MANSRKRHIDTETEREALRQFYAGKRPKEIAHSMGLKIWSVYRMAAQLPLFTKHLTEINK